MSALKFAAEVHELYEIFVNAETVRRVIQSKAYARVAKKKKLWDIIPYQITL